MSEQVTEPQMLLMLCEWLNEATCEGFDCRWCFISAPFYHLLVPGNCANGGDGAACQTVSPAGRLSAPLPTFINGGRI